MPIYMDRHDVSEKVTAAVVAELHQQDLMVQDKFNCRGLTYWFDDKRKTAFCLIEAPNKKAIQEMHDQAHGEVPHQIIEVNAGLVESFLGRIEDPERLSNDELNIIDEPAFRVIMVTGFDDCSFKKGLLNIGKSNLADCMNSLSSVIRRFNGLIVEQNQNHFLVSFKSVYQAIDCALDLHLNFEDWSDTVKCEKINLKTGISSGVPVAGNRSFFEDAVKAAKQMFFLSNSKIVVSAEVNELYMHENRNVFLNRDLFVTLSHSDEKFVDSLMNFLAETWQNPYLQVEDFGKHLGYSKSQLYRKMISLVGMSPNNFIKDYRLSKALGLITRQIGNIAEIAYESGFNSPSYFTKCFHHKYGFLPSEYLQNVTE